MGDEDHAIADGQMPVKLADGRTATVEMCADTWDAFEGVEARNIQLEQVLGILACACCNGTGNHGAGYANSPHGGEYACLPCRGYGAAHATLPDGAGVVRRAP